MVESDKLKVSLILLGKEANPILDMLSKIKNIELTIICATFLNYELPRSEDKKSIVIRGELIQTLKTITKDIEANFPIPPTIKKSFLEDLEGIEPEEDIGIIYNINTIEDHSSTLNDTFDGLEKLVGDTDLEIVPLTDEDDDIIVYKNKKWAPLRYYLNCGKLPFDESKFNAGEKRVKMTGKSMHIHGLDQIVDDEIPEETLKEIDDSDLLLISSTDLISLGLFLRSETAIKQLQKIVKVGKSILIWNKLEQTEIESDILSILNMNTEIGPYLKPLLEIIDYVVVDQDIEVESESITEYGAKFLSEKLPSKEERDIKEYRGFIESIISIAGSSIIPVFPEDDEEESTPKNPIEEKTNGSLKTIDELHESKKEQGIQKVPEIEEEELETDEYITLQSKEEVPKSEGEPKEEELDKANEPTEQSPSQEINVENKIEQKKEIEDDVNIFDPEVSESWEDALKRAINVYIDEGAEPAYTWIIKQIERDPDLRENISQVLLNRLLSSEGTAQKKKTISLLKQMFEFIKQSIVQVFSAYLLNTITSKDFEKTRDFVFMFTLLQSEMIEFCEDIIRSIIKDITIKREDPLIFEMSKLTLIQLVIHSRRLKRISISKILTLMDARIDSSPTYLWNFLMCFDAGSVAVELVTQFSISRSEELINRTPLLRYTGSFFTTLQMVMTYWKSGDQIAITEITGSILPDNTIRKLERMDLASKIEKLGTVPLTTLAKTLGKDPEEIERLIAELIMNDDIDVRLEVVDNRMIVMYNQNVD